MITVPQGLPPHRGRSVVGASGASNRANWLSGVKGKFLGESSLRTVGRLFWEICETQRDSGSEDFLAKTTKTTSHVKTRHS